MHAAPVTVKIEARERSAFKVVLSRPLHSRVEIIHQDSKNTRTLKMMIHIPPQKSVIEVPNPGQIEIELKKRLSFREFTISL